MGKKRCAFQIDLSIKSLDEVESEIDDIDMQEKTKQEISKIMDAVWEKYPKAEVAKTESFENGNRIILEIK